MARIGPPGPPDKAGGVLVLYKKRKFIIVEVGRPISVVPTARRLTNHLSVLLWLRRSMTRLPVCAVLLTDDVARSVRLIKSQFIANTNDVGFLLAA